MCMYKSTAIRKTQKIREMKCKFQRQKYNVLFSLELEIFVVVYSCFKQKSLYYINWHVVKISIN